MSDLHIESCEWALSNPPPEFDVLIAAGDIHDPASLGVAWLNAQAKGKPVIYVPGNHEWYAPWFDTDVETEQIAARGAADGTSVHFLMDEAVVIDGVRFLGSTLWTDFSFYKTPLLSMRYASRAMSDFRVIYPTDAADPLTPEQTVEWHNASRAWLSQELAKDPVSDEWSRTVVVTHHLPHENSVAPEWDGDRLNPAFVSDMEQFVESCGAQLWVHGHTHNSCDYVVGDTRVLCNPKGYGPRVKGAPIENRYFNPNLVVDI